MKKKARFDFIPPAIHQTLDWLIEREHREAARELALAVRSGMPSGPISDDFFAYVLFQTKHYREAKEVSEKALSGMRYSPDAHFNAAKCASAAGYPEEGERFIRRALELRPGWTEAEVDLAAYVASQGRFDEAMKMLEGLRGRISAGDDDADVVEFNLGWHYIRHGDFKRGMKGLLIGRRLKIWGSHGDSYSAPKLSPGMALGGKTVLVCGEGGIGDEIINARFARTIAGKGGRVIWKTSHKIAPVLSRVEGISAVVENGKPEAGAVRYDLWAPAMDLPALLDLGMEDISGKPYLSVDPAHAEKWKMALPDSGKFRIGIRWKGNALYEQDLLRSVPFGSLEKLAEIPGAEIFSFQKDEGAEDRPADSPVIDLAPKLESWEDTLAALSRMDLVVTSCTSVAHASAALGKKTWVMLPLNCYYLWAVPGDVSPWYDAVRLFRQTSLHTWEEPSAKMLGEASEAVKSKKTA